MRLASVLAILALAACSQPPAEVKMTAPATGDARASSLGAPHGGAPAPNARACIGADWQSTGYRHGLSGYPPTALGKLDAACEGTGAKVDRLAYSTGRLKGLSVFCTAENGYRRARAGQPPAHVCPPSLAKEYERGHAAGSVAR